MPLRPISFTIWQLISAGWSQELSFLSLDLLAEALNSQTALQYQHARAASLKAISTSETSLDHLQSSSHSNERLTDVEDDGPLTESCDPSHLILISLPSTTLRSEFAVEVSRRVCTISWIPTSPSI